MIAVGIYLKILRERQNIRRSQLADVVGLTEQHLWKIEEKGQETTATKLARIVQALRGDWSDIETLLLRDTSTDRAAELARRRFRALENDIPGAEAALAAAQSADITARLRLAEDLLQSARSLAERRRD